MQSPDYVRLSLAAAMTLDFAPGLFHRNARLRCVNLLLTYENGCKANCAFCGLARERRGNERDKRFIRVAWKTHPSDEVIARLEDHPPHVERVCISMITNTRSRADAPALCRRIRERTDLPVSLLITPTTLTRADLVEMKEAGADRIGVAIDGATPEIFDRLRGRGVKGPHKWDHYWTIYEQALEVFGRDRAGVHLIVGLGETEDEMARAIGRSRDLGGGTHLFSFFPERGSVMENHPQPPMGRYRRIQAARYLIDNDVVRAESMAFDDAGRITDFGLARDRLEKVLAGGEAFETSGCPGASGRTACNRPYGNERPGPDIRNFPFRLEPEDFEKAWREMADYGA